MDTQYTDIDGFRIYHVEIGSGEPVILMHGLGGSWQDWLANIPELSQSFRVCAIDLPGFGMSSPPAGPIEYNLVFVANLIRKFMDSKGYQHAFLIGNSMGGGIALRCAIDYPERVQGLVLANGVGLGKEIGLFIRLLSFPGAARLSIPFVTKEHVRAIWRILFFNPAIITEAMINRTWEWIQKPETKRFLIQLYPKAATIRGQRHLLLSEVLKIRCPTLITWGINDTVLPVKHAVTAYNEIQTAQLYLFRKCGHVPQIEQADEFTQATLKFLSAQNMPAAPGR